MQYSSYFLGQLSKIYLKEENPRTMVQKNGETDNCKNEFSGSRQRNNVPSSFDCNQITSKRSGVRKHASTKKKIVQVEIQNFGRMH